VSRRPYLRTLPRTTWFLAQPRYRAYMLREATCLIVAVYCALLLAALATLAKDDASAWAALLQGQQQPAWIVFHALALLYFWAFQSVPWFRLAPRAMPLPVRRLALAARLVVATHYAACALVTAAVLHLSGAL